MITKRNKKAFNIAIPPAWKNVQIAKSAKAKVLATGEDEAGRKQTIYNETFVQQQAEKKYDRALEFSKCLPALREQVDKDLRKRSLNKNRVIACIIHLLDIEFFRVGNSRYTKKYASYGITTVQSKHLTMSKSVVVFNFTGKSGKKQFKKIRDRRVLRLLKRLAQLPGSHLFRFLDDVLCVKIV